MLNKVFFSSIAALLTAILGVAVLQNAFADTGIIKLQPATGSTEKSNTFSVNIVIDPGTGVDGVETTINYNPSHLQFVSIDSGGSAFPIELEESGGNGKVEVTRGILGSTVSANGSLVTKVTFKALVGGVTTSLDLSGNSTAGGKYQNPATQDATRTLTSTVASDPEPEPDPSPTPPSPDDPDDPNEPAPTKPKPNKPGSGGGGGSGGNREKPPATKPNKPERIGNRTIKLLPPAFRRLVFELSGGNAFKAYVKFGTGEELNLSTSISKLSKVHKIALDEKLLVPGTEYKYKVVIQEKDGKLTESQVKTVRTKGYTVVARVLDGNNKPLANKLVTLRSDPINARTDENGTATFKDVAPGRHTLVYTDGDKQYGKPIEVKDTVKTAAATSADPQTFAVVYGEVRAFPYSPGLIAALVGVVVAIGFALVFGLGKFSKTKVVGQYVAPTGAESYGQSNQNVVVGGQQSQNNNQDINSMLDKVEGGTTSDPGSLVSPEDKDRQQ